MDEAFPRDMNSILLEPLFETVYVYYTTNRLNMLYLYCDEKTISS
jgi:hypothetical protein